MPSTAKCLNRFVDRLYLAHERVLNIFGMRMMNNKVENDTPSKMENGTHMELHPRSKSIISVPPEPEFVASIRRESMATIASSGGKKFDSMSTTTGRSSLSRVKIAMGFCSDDPRTTNGRRRQLAKIIVMAAIPIIILIIQSGISVASAFAEQSYATSFIWQVQFAMQAGAVVHALGLERGTTTFYVGMPNESALLLPPVLTRRGQVDKALAAMTLWPSGIKLEDGFYATKQDMVLQIYINRIFVNQSSPMEQLEFFTNMIASLMNWIGDAVIHSQSSEQRWQDLVAYHSFITAKEGYAAERSAGTVFYSKGNMTPFIHLWYHNQRSVGMSFMNKSMQYNSYIRKVLIDRWYGSPLQQNISVERARIDDNFYNPPDVRRGLFWYSSMSSYQNILYDIETNLTANISQNLNQAVAGSTATVAVQLFVVVLALVLFPSVIILLSHVTGQIQKFAHILQTKNDEVTREKKRTETVLNQLMPRQVAEKIKLGQPIYPESFDQVTVFFSDIVQFTDLSSASTPLQVVDTLNKLYTIMDKRIEAHDVYKVETIGDAYLCVSGLPERNENRHSFEIASMSLDLVGDVRAIRLPHKPTYELRIRIGLHTGPCVAGIIGIKMPRYCVFGDTVNTASRMESNGEALKVHMSSTTFEALTYFGVFEMEKRGEIPIKGKGMMVTYWLTSKRETKRKLFAPDVKS